MHICLLWVVGAGVSPAPPSVSLGQVWGRQDAYPTRNYVFALEGLPKLVLTQFENCFAKVTGASVEVQAAQLSAGLALTNAVT